MQLYDSLTRTVVDLVPADGRTVKIYTCGPTVYRYAHIGNMRTFMLGDLIRRAVLFEGEYDVEWIMNITDVGHMTDEVSDAGRDRMDLAMEDEGLLPLEIAEKYTEAFLEDADAVGILRADAYPRATDHIAEMIELTSRLIGVGNAYEVGGSVYFDVHSFPAYGRLSGNTPERLRAGHRQELEIDPNKRSPVDFALWKHATEHRLMKWPSPWGNGFPGWHVECSAMSMKYLGERFDVHTGGNDLKFPHHEDEIAQSEAAVGHQVVGPLAFRLLTFGSRYRSEMDFSWEALEGENERLRTLRQRMAEWKAATAARTGRAEDDIEPLDTAAQLDAGFREAVAEDLDMPRALVVLAEAVSADLPPATKYDLLVSWDQVLGLDLERLATLDAELPSQVTELIAERDRARAERDYAESDAIRDRLTAMGYDVMDTPEGTKVRPHG
jgi:cysteinyl-tRNA synthetase